MNEELWQKIIAISKLKDDQAKVEAAQALSAVFNIPYTETLDISQKLSRVIENNPELITYLERPKDD